MSTFSVSVFFFSRCLFFCAYTPAAETPCALLGYDYDVPFLAPWKKNRTTNTCNPAIDTIIKPSITLKLKIRLSVLRTVLKLRFSRVRKYFWFREIVDSCADSLKIDSSSAVACSGLVPGRDGN